MDTLGWVYYQKGFYDSAIREFEESLQKMPDNPIIHYHLGLAYYRNDAKEKARVQFEKALSIDNNFKHAEEIKKLLAEF